MSISAKITDVDSTNPLNPIYHFELFDDNKTGEVSVVDSISLAHATYLVEFELPAVCHTAYQNMVNAIANCESYLIVGAEFPG